MRDTCNEKVYIPESACDIERNIHKFLDSQEVYAIDIKQFLCR